MSLLNLNGVSKAYAGVPALRSLSMSIEPGEIHALMGENGAGKSTLIKILAGAVVADAAEIELHGRPIAIDHPQAAFDHGLRFIHQELNVAPALSVAESIFLGRAYPRRFGALVDWGRLATVARQALARLGVQHIDPRIRMGRLGVGDRMLVCISAAFLDRGVAAPSLYVLDEPTAALTGVEAERLFQVLRQIRDSGRSILYVTHRLDEVMRICNRVTVLRDGAVVATRTIADISQHEIIRLMTGREVSEAYPPPLAPAAEDVALAVRDLAGEGVDRVSFELRKGEIVGVAGLSGAGQSELLRLVMGADKARHGFIRIGGCERRRQGLSEAWRAGLAFVPRERRSEGLVLTRPIYENITLPHLKRFSRGGVFLSRRLELGIAWDRGGKVRLKAQNVRQRCLELSGGNQQKVVFAKALARRPAVLLLDEPTRGVDVGARFDIYSLLRELGAEGAAVLIASSDFPELLGLCDRIMVMRDGAISAVLDADGLTEEALLNHCYGLGEPGAAEPHTLPLRA